MAGWTPKRNIEVLTIDLPAGTEVTLSKSDFTAIADVGNNASIKGIEVQCRDNLDIRFGKVSGSTTGATPGPYKTIKKGTTLFFEDTEFPMDYFNATPWRFNNASGTGTTVLEVEFSHG